MLVRSSTRGSSRRCSARSTTSPQALQAAGRRVAARSPLTPVAFGPDEIERLYEGLGQDRPPKLVHVAANGSGEAGFEARVGQKAPDLSLPDLEGQSVRLADVQGKSRALLFFDPDCGFCAQMVDDLLACERRPPTEQNWCWSPPEACSKSAISG